MLRRSILAGGILVAAAGREATAQPIAAAPNLYVLVHGAFHGGWCWQSVAALLRAQGHVVYTPTLTGLGERSHLLPSGPTLETFITDVMQVLRYEELTNVILVGHSLSGPVVSAVADRMRDRVRHLVYLDALLLQNGEAAADQAPERVEAHKQRAIASGHPPPYIIPPAPPQYFGLTEPRSSAWVASKLTPHPLQTYYDKLKLAHPLGNGLPVTYIACTAPYFTSVDSSRALAKTLPGWKYVEMATGHDAMVSEPRELVRILSSLR